jgi:FAD/FMN-containing dehydrogenase
VTGTAADGGAPAPGGGPALVAALGRIVGGRHVLTDPDLTGSYRTDWTRRFTGDPLCVVRPADTAEVAAVVAACAAAGAPVTVQGGNTGLVAGAVPGDGDVLLSLTRLTALEPVDAVASQVTVGAGVTLANLQAHARAAGLDFGVDLAARDSATVGGLTATNAGGIRVLRHGDMRAQVVGVEAVLADGTVVAHLGGLPKDNTGYDLVGLLTGSEGTLAALTRVRVRLVPPLDHRVVALVAVEGTGPALDVLRSLRAAGLPLAAAELCYADGVDLVRSYASLKAPFDQAYPAYLLVECAGPAESEDDLLAALGEADGVADATVASDPRGREALWRYREAHTEAISAAGVPVKLDVAVPVGRLAAFTAELPAAVAGAAPGARSIVFGHVNEGNLHVNVLDAVERAEPVTDAVLRLVASYGGSISAEHGIGRAKGAWLPLCRGEAELAMMRRIKAGLDPADLFGRGVLLGSLDAAR